MTPLRLTSWFRARMAAAAAVTALLVATAAPVAYHVQKRRELVQAARLRANLLAEVLRVEVAERPRLWRYDATKLGERIAAAGLDGWPLRLYADGVLVPVDATELHAATPHRVLWGRADVDLGDAPTGGRTSARIWVAIDAAPLWIGTAWLAAAFSVLALVLGLALYLFPVSAIAAAELRIAQLMNRLALTLQEEDRRRIARDLHDGVGQAITAARLEMLALLPRAPAIAAPSGPDGEGNPDGNTAHLRRITKNLDEALDELRRSTTALAPPALSELGLAGALERHCHSFADATGLRVTCEVAPLPKLSAEVELACYRIVQEALSNTARHAHATSAAVRLYVEDGWLRLRICDDGRGLGAGRPDSSGIGGIRERAQLLGGRLQMADADPGSSARGVRVDVDLPLAQREIA